MVKDGKYLLAEIKVVTGKNKGTLQKRISEASEKADGILLNIESTAFSGKDIINTLKERLIKHKDTYQIKVGLYGKGYEFTLRDKRSKKLRDKLDLWKIK